MENRNYTVESRRASKTRRFLPSKTLTTEDTEFHGGNTAIACAFVASVAFLRVALCPLWLSESGAPKKLYVTWHMNEPGNRLIAGLVARELK